MRLESVCLRGSISLRGSASDQCDVLYNVETSDLCGNLFFLFYMCGNLFFPVFYFRCCMSLIFRGDSFQHYLLVFS